LLSFSLVWAITLIDNFLDFRYHQSVSFNLTDKLSCISLRVTRMFPSPSHHLGIGIIVQARYLIDRDCGKKVWQALQRAIKFSNRLSSGIRLRWCTVKVNFKRSDLVKSLEVPDRRHCWLHACQCQASTFFHGICDFSPIFGIPVGFCHNTQGSSFFYHTAIGIRSGRANSLLDYYDDWGDRYYIPYDVTGDRLFQPNRNCHRFEQ
jgi:hypothetical protein